MPLDYITCHICVQCKQVFHILDLDRFNVCADCVELERELLEDDN